MSRHTLLTPGPHNTRRPDDDDEEEEEDKGV